MKPFMDADFLLSTDTAKKLYHEYAKNTPVLDYHCHLEPKEIAEDITFETLTQLWLGGDHYKWRIMRSNGVSEEYITGDAPDEEKFHAFVQALQKAVGNPMYHWCHLELQRYFDVYEPLTEENWKEVYEHCNKKLKDVSMSARNLIRKSNVTMVCTTDDPVDDLHFHEKIWADPTFTVQVLPAWRPDKAFALNSEGFCAYMDRLSQVSGVKVCDWKSYQEAMKARLDYFVEHRCLVTDHGLDVADYIPTTDEEADALLKRALKGEAVTEGEMLAFTSAALKFLGKEYKKRNMVMQLHCGARRENNRRIFEKVGPNGGIDCISESGFTVRMADLLNELDQEGALPKTILYSLNPNDDAIIGTMIGCFQGDGVHGKIQHGAAWWFNDHKPGMIKQMTSLASLGLLGNFVGMLTDSRSFVSYPRHEYFRRILCDLIGGWVENGEFPNDDRLLGSLIKDISYNNAVRYFGFDLETR